MTDSLDTAVHRYAGRPETATDESPVETIGCIGVRRTSGGLSVMVDLRMQSGDRWAIPYSHVDNMRLQEGSTITIALGKTEVTIVGRRLTSLYDRLVEQRVGWVREADRTELFAEEADTEPLVERISVLSKEDKPPSV